MSDHHEVEGFRGYGESGTHSAVSSPAVLGEQTSSGKLHSFKLYVSVALNTVRVPSFMCTEETGATGFCGYFRLQ